MFGELAAHCVVDAGQSHIQSLTGILRIVVRTRLESPHTSSYRKWHHVHLS